MFNKKALTCPMPCDPQPSRASSEHQAQSEPRTSTSTSGEAQACFNLILILQHDTQHLILLRNDNLSSLEETAATRPLLDGINEAITAATRSIKDLGPFLERHRWPPEPPQPKSSVRLKVLRKRSRSLSAPAAGTGTGTDSDLSPEELFSWTLALTAQHTAVLVAFEKLERFLVHGLIAINENEQKRREARDSWWQQGRSEFENVGLIQSLLQRPRRNLRRPTDTAVTILVAEKPEDGQMGGATASPPGSASLPSISEYDDWRSETLSEQSTRSAPSEMHGLTARPKPMPVSYSHAHYYLSREPSDAYNQAIRPETPASSNSVVAVEAEYPGAEESQPSGDASRSIPLSPPFNTNRQRPRVATTPLPPLLGLQALLTSIPPRYPSANIDGGTTMSGSPDSAISPLLSPLSIPGLDQSSSQGNVPSPSQASPSPETPYTPLDQQLAVLFAQKALPSKTIQPVVHDLDTMVVSPLEMHPVYELSPSRATSSARSGSSPPLYDDRHWPYLAYMARKQAVATSRWSVWSSRSSRSDSEGRAQG